jgi:hypothetical protein
MNRKAKVYLVCTVALGSLLTIDGLSRWHTTVLASWLGFSMMAIAASGCKVKLPRMEGTYSLSFIFVLVTCIKFSLGEAIVTGCTAVVTQRLWKREKPPTAIQMAFNVAAMAITVSACSSANQFALAILQIKALAVVLTAAVYFMVNTYQVAIIMALVAGEAIQAVWRQWFLWSFPIYVVGAVVAAAEVMCGEHVSAQVLISTLPLLCLIYAYYRQIIAAVSHRRMEQADQTIS